MIKKYKGFTLLETVVVLAILGIVLTIAVPKAKPFLKSKEIKEVKVLAYCLKETKRLSLKSGVSHTFFIHGDTYGIKDIKGRIIYREALEVLQPAEGGNLNEVSFTGKGRPDMESSGRFILEGVERYAIIIAPVTGNIRWERL